MLKLQDTQQASEYNHDSLSKLWAVTGRYVFPFGIDDLPKNTYYTIPSPTYCFFKILKVVCQKQCQIRPLSQPRHQHLRISP